MLNVPYLLGYGFAEFSEFLKAYEQGNASAPLGACSQHIAQAKYYIGTNSNLALKIIAAENN
jgi:hypothetical protein